MYESSKFRSEFIDRVDVSFESFCLGSLRLCLIAYLDSKTKIHKSEIGVLCVNIILFEKAWP